MKLEKGIKSHCHINSNSENDRFVGVKGDVEGVSVHFPIGYELPENELEIKRDILHLFNVLLDFTDSKSSELSNRQSEDTQKVNFPINAYLEVIYSYMKSGFYMEHDPVYKTGTRGKINWSKTIKEQKPLVQKRNKSGLTSLIYTEYTIRESSPNKNKEITRIHQHCVYESFDKIGWLFTTSMPPKPSGTLDTRRFLYILNNKLRITNNDQDKRLLKSMIDILEYLDVNNDEKQFFFGTDNFGSVWERLINKTFGIKNKDNYFPRAKWRLQQGLYRDSYPLQPDTIMINGDKIYVLDAKYYRFGNTKNPNDLPNVASINKQITYGEYIYKKQNLSNEKLYNAFLMPYNMADNLFGFNEPYANIGEAYGEWKGNDYNYERIQGILVDVRYLMYHYTGNQKRNIIKLAESIEKALKENDDLLSESIRSKNR